MFVLIFFLTNIVPPGEEDEGAHPHDGLELADGKGFIAVRETRYQKLLPQHICTCSLGWKQGGVADDYKVG